MKKIGLLFSLAVVFAFSSCSFVGDLSVEKRHYNKGFYVHVRNDRNENQNNIPSPEVTVSNHENVAGEINATENTTTAIPVSATASTSNTQTALKSIAPKHRTASAPKLATKQNPAIQEKPASVSTKPEPKPAAGGDTNEIILVILAILISPLAVYLKEGATTRFWIDLICWLLGAGVVGFFFYGGGLLLFAIVFALLIVLGII